jgi:hypothetical protein
VTAAALGCGRVSFDPVSDVGTADVVAAGPIRLVQNASQLYAGVPSASISFAAPPAAGNFVWISVTTYGAGSIQQVSDNQSNGYAMAFMAPITVCGLPVVWGFYSRVVQSNSGAFTITVNAGQVWSMHIREYAASVDLSKSSIGTGIGALGDSGPVDVTSGGMIVAAQTHCQTLITSAGAGWTNHVVTTENQASQALSTEDMLEPVPGTYHGTFSFAPPDTMGWAVGAASFIP